jgi:hypothetical protein
MQSARERVAQLETYEARLLEEARIEADVRNQEIARERAILALASEFGAAEVSQGPIQVRRPSLGMANANLAWIEPRVEKNPLLQSMKPRQVLELVLAASRKEDAA